MDSLCSPKEQQSYDQKLRQEVQKEDFVELPLADDSLQVEASKIKNSEEA